MDLGGYREYLNSDAGINWSDLAVMTKIGMNFGCDLAVLTVKTR